MHEVASLHPSLVLSRPLIVSHTPRADNFHNRIAVPTHYSLIVTINQCFSNCITVNFHGKIKTLLIHACAYCAEEMNILCCQPVLKLYEYLLYMVPAGYSCSHRAYPHLAYVVQHLFLVYTKTLNSK